MGNKLYVGNLPYSATEEELTTAFSEAGAVTSVKIITDRESGRSKGFGFVEMATDTDAQNAVSKLNGAEYAGRTITVSEARPMEPRAPRGPGGGGGGGGGGYGGGGGDRGGRGGGGGDRGGRGGGGGGGRGGY